jgi:hypothetical protein
MTYFSSFTMYLGSQNEVIINVNVDIDSTYNYQFCKKYFNNKSLNKYLFFLKMSLI